MNSLDCPTDPAERWRLEATRYGADESLRLRLAAMAGHMHGDRVAARRGSLIDVLKDGRPHTSEDVRRRVESEVGDGCWGKRPEETLLRDLRALRRGGIRIAYSRRSGLEGYYLDYPPLTTPHATWHFDDPAWVERVRQMTIAQKQLVAYRAADDALRQKRLILAEEQPYWSAEQIEREARRLVYGAKL